MRVIYESSYADVEELRKRLEEFRSQYQKRKRLPEDLSTTTETIDRQAEVTEGTIIETLEYAP